MAHQEQPQGRTEMLKLTAKMSEALEYIDAYGNTGVIHPRTLAALVRHKLISTTDIGDAPFRYQVTTDGAAAFSTANRKHLGGRFTVQPAPAMGPEAFDHLPADHPAPITTAAPDYLSADTVRVGQRVYLYDGRSDAQVAGNVVAVIGHALDTIVVEALVPIDGRPVKVLFYRDRVRTGDQLRAAVEQVAGVPFPLGSKVAMHLAAERVYRVDSVEVGTYDKRTRVYLVHPDGERLAFLPSVLAKMFAPALEPFPNANHLIGERVTLTSADPRQAVGTISGTIASVRPAPLGSAHAVAVLKSGYLVDLPASLVEATAPRG